jgi:hypothetical protein
MGPVQHNVVTPPNQNLIGLSRNRGMGEAFATGPADTDTPNYRGTFADGGPGGSGPLTRMASQVQGPNHRFNVANAGMSQPPSTSDPGKGAVPVEPFTPLGRPATTNSPLRDSAQR